MTKKEEIELAKQYEESSRKYDYGNGFVIIDHFELLKV